MIAVRDLRCGYDGRAVVENVSFEVERGQVLVLLGPNGVGKTTLFKTVLGLLPRLGGEVLLDGAPLDAKPGSDDLKRIAYVPQAHVPAFAFTVAEVVVMGRTPRIKAFAAPSERDRAFARKTLVELGLEHLAERPYTEVSGGERQMILIARALVQEPDVLIMDEPAASLDFGNQAILLRMVRDLSRSRGLSVLMTSHNPDHALLVADKVLLLSKGGGCRCGRVEDVLDDESLTDAYGTPIDIIEKAAGPNGAALRSCVLRL
ncbi:hypothetical protein C1878_02190 [Gordonibacter sp. 28C]|uniref:ABC transporter ATP-binding protein n=1 Tax=Gordonibacter sp. 28C TaxID=2078569 RepID=UPI000DF7F9A2|nr:ABC transporter ATP-binding protein [Gordonibacter sp. 28C]RDB64670.1 hypothetical protein C1878_02190 [Gordonibacter sp. 28C]